MTTPYITRVNDAMCCNTFTTDTMRVIHFGSMFFPALSIHTPVGSILSAKPLAQNQNTTHTIVGYRTKPFVLQYKILHILHISEAKPNMFHKRPNKQLRLCGFESPRDGSMRPWQWTVALHWVSIGSCARIHVAKSVSGLMAGHGKNRHRRRRLRMVTKRLLSGSTRVKTPNARPAMQQRWRRCWCQ